MRSIFSLIVLLALGLSAEAHWQYSRWGMSLGDLLAANKSVKNLSLEEQRGQSIKNLGSALAEANYLADGVPTRAVFYFRSDKLMAVRLNTKNVDDGYRLLNALSSVYGKPIREVDQNTSGLPCREVRREWHDSARGNRVTISILNCPNSGLTKGLSTASILYEPIRSKDDTGL